METKQHKRADVKPSPKILQRFRELASDESELSYLVDGFLPDDSRTLLVGDSGVGKSTFAAQLCSSLQIGQSFLGMITKQTNCLYFQADVGVPIWREQIKRIAPMSDAWSLHSIPNGALDKPEYIEVIKKVIEYVKPDFVVYDALNTLTAKDINGKAVMEIVYLMQNVAAYQDGMPIPQLLIHHPSKDGKRGVNGAAGYHGISAAYDTYLNLGLTRLKVEKSRVITNKVIRLEKDSLGLWHVQKKRHIDLETDEAVDESGHNTIPENAIGKTRSNGRFSLDPELNITL
jgi:RecA-family ATPase